MADLFDVLIIGGGPAGLAAALPLARLLHKVVLFDSGIYRNRFADHMHSLSTWDHQPPQSYRAAAHKELTTRYDVEIAKAGIHNIEKRADDSFKATDSQGKEWIGRKLLLATGSKDIYPEITGFEECWGSKIYHCLFCHGFEEKGSEAAGILAIGEVANTFMASHLTKQACQFAEQVFVYTNGNEKLATELESTTNELKKARIDNRMIKSFGCDEVHIGKKLTIEFGNGQHETINFLVHKPKTKLNGTFAQQLGLELTQGGDLKVAQPFPETSVKGCFAAGDCATAIKAVPPAISAGMMAAAGVSMQLVG